MDLQARLRRSPQDAQSLTLLGIAYQQRYRETANSAYLVKADGVLRTSLRLRPRRRATLTALGSLALSRHQFREALRLGRQAVALEPREAQAHGVVGDALVELGRHPQAFKAFDTMARLDPGVASYARVAYGRELIGRTQAAIAAMQLARDSAANNAEATAWAGVELGKLFWSVGQVNAAAREFRAALAALPGYVFALDGLAQAEAARGRYGTAIALARRAVDTIPLPQFLATLGDLYRVTGRERLARQQYAVVGAIRRVLAADGVDTDLDVAVFNIDHGIDLRRSLVLARAGYENQPSIFGDDALAWALMRNGRCRDALGYSRRALRLGTRDAVKFFHRGMIERCLGRDTEARTWFRKAVSLNPHFSLLWAPVARRYAS